MYTRKKVIVTQKSKYKVHSFPLLVQFSLKAIPSKVGILWWGQGKEGILETVYGALKLRMVSLQEGSISGCLA